MKVKERQFTVFQERKSGVGRISQTCTQHNTYGKAEVQGLEGLDEKGEGTEYRLVVTK